MRKKQKQMRCRQFTVASVIFTDEKCACGYFVFRNSRISANSIHFVNIFREIRQATPTYVISHSDGGGGGERGKRQGKFGFAFPFPGCVPLALQWFDSPPARRRS